MSTPRESWLFRVELPAGVEAPGRLVARLLKHLLRVWGVKATAILDAPPEMPIATPHAAPDATRGTKEADGP